MTIGAYIKVKQPETYKKLKSIYPIISRHITDEREHRELKRLMETGRHIRL